MSLPLNNVTVGSTSALTLHNLPSELLDIIISEIELPSDLLPLALTCSLFASLIIPDHLRYRVIRCTIPVFLSLQGELGSSKSLAQHVRFLELTPVPPTLIPSPCESLPLDTKEATNAQLHRALRNMNQLISFLWGPDGGPDAGPPLNCGDLWKSLCSLPSLRHVDVAAWVVPTEGFSMLTSNSMWDVTGLRSLKLRGSISASAGLEPFKEEGNLLSLQNPNLETLVVDVSVFEGHYFARTDLSHLLHQCSFSSLRHVRFGGPFNTAISAEAALKFIISHPLLEDIEAGDNFGSDVADMDSLENHEGLSGQPLLPNVRRIGLSYYWVLLILSSHKRDALPPLVDLRCTGLDTDARLGILGSFLSHLPKLLRLETRRPPHLFQSLRMFAQCAPWLEWVILKNDHDVSGLNLKDTATLRELLSLLSNFPHLKAFHGIQLLASEIGDPWNDTIIALLLQACPNLEHIDWKWEEGVDPWTWTFCTTHYAGIVNHGCGVFSWKLVLRDDIHWQL